MKTHMQHNFKLILIYLQHDSYFKITLYNVIALILNHNSKDF